MENQPWHVGKLMQTSSVYWQTCTLHCSVKLDIFTVIGDGELTAADIAEQIKSDERGTRMLLNALSAMELLTKKADAYANTEASSAFLSKDSDQYIGYMILHHHYLMASWNQMDQAVLEGRPTRSRSSSSDEARRESFLMGMFNSAMAIAPALSKTLDLTGCRRLLDYGGGPGTFAIHFCLANPQLSAVVYDLPTTRPFAEKTISQFGLSDRVSFVAGDFVQADMTDYTAGFDAAWLSHILHGEGPETALAIIKKAVSALTPGGRIFIHEFILNNHMDGPLFPALFSLNMLLGTPDGQSYSEAQLAEMLDEAGIRDIRRLDFSGPTGSGILAGEKPGS